MSEQARSERKTQNRVSALFTDTSRLDCLGYTYLGEWSRRDEAQNLKQAMMQELLTGGMRRV